MEAVSYSHARQNLAGLMDKVNQDRTPLLVTRQSGDAVVVLAKGEYDGLMETLHQYASSANAQRLRESITQLDAGQVVEWVWPALTCCSRPIAGRTIYRGNNRMGRSPPGSMP